MPPSLRGYQSAALAAWEVAGRRGVIVLPTGAGKTRVAVAAIARVRRPTLCVVPTRVLLHQWAGALEEAGFADVGRLGDGCSDLRDVTVDTFESAYRAMPRVGHRFDFPVVDEVHHCGLGVRDLLLAMSVARSRLGLTAQRLRHRTRSSAISGLVASNDHGCGRPFCVALSHVREAFGQGWVPPREPRHERQGLLPLVIGEGEPHPRERFVDGQLGCVFSAAHLRSPLSASSKRRSARSLSRALQRFVWMRSSSAGTRSVTPSPSWSRTERANTSSKTTSSPSRVALERASITSMWSPFSMT
ncbi:MAG: DEAD/DEAH box helicase family protein [Sandaracinaceae bacterium]|nr:DEAD/DEAH box helicase family protein [Sandaracinaceae bacterium]